MTNLRHVDYKNDMEKQDPEELERFSILNDAELIVNTMATENKKLTDVANNGKEQDDDNEEKVMKEEIDRLFKSMPLNDDTTCGFWIFKGSFFQRFANKKAYVLLYGFVGSIFSMTYGYFSGTITTIEKRYKIPSKNTGIITVGYDISQLLVSAALGYYAGKGHRPRWIGFGLLNIVIFCLMTALPHFLHGSGKDALRLTTEYGGIIDANATIQAINKENSKELCKLKACEREEDNLAPQIVLFTAQFISGIGGSLYYTMSVSYMDDNIKRSKTPALLSLSYFMRMLGPAVGYALASFCLQIYISPTLTPIINNNDPRWLGAWWMGWIVLGVALFLSSIFLTMFPKELPRAAARRILKKDSQSRKEIKVQPEESELPASFKDMIKTFKELTKNLTYMFNNIASVFYFFGDVPYWIFTPKYIEIQYRQSAATSSLVTGTVALAFTAVGVLLAGFVISKYKPRARYMAVWNVAVGLFSVMGMITYAFLGCPGNESSMVVNISESNAFNDLNPTCNSQCQCDYVRYSPICGEDGNTYISPCHAACKQQFLTTDENKVFSDCSCISNSVNATSTTPELESWLSSVNKSSFDAAFKFSAILSSSEPSAKDVRFIGKAIPGACPVNCFKQFVMFLSVMCFLKFIGATGRASNFLVSVRCVPEKDKTAAMGFGLMMMSLLAFIPSPIFFGWVLDRLCLVWGKTCTSKGNCWLYDAQSLRYNLNIMTSSFVFIGTIFDIGVWYFVKDLKIFDEEVKGQELRKFDEMEEVATERSGKRAELQEKAFLSNQLV